MGHACLHPIGVGGETEQQYPFWDGETMTIYSRINPVQAPENPKGKTVQQIDEALRDFVLQDTGHLRREVEDVTRGGSITTLASA
jgi:hypothetical protein